MDKIKLHAEIMDLRQDAKLIYWLADGATPYQHDVLDRIEQIAEKAEELASFARQLAIQHREKADK